MTFDFPALSKNKKMIKNQQLLWVKIIHTGIWIFFNLVLVYLFYAVLSHSVDYKFWIGVGFIGLECLVLVINRWSCPLTFVARKYSDSQKDNFDIFLPEWLARHNKTIYTVIALLLVVLYLAERSE